MPFRLNSSVLNLAPQICTARVMHARLLPKTNRFTYGVYYLLLPLPAAPMTHGRVRFDPSDVGYCDGRDPEPWARETLQHYGVSDCVAHIMLMTMPRVLGHVFNPVSFYFGLDTERRLRVVIAEVHNTFGERHAYVCAHADATPIAPGDTLQAEKVFHVSPFLERAGHYRFRFALNAADLRIEIDYYDREGRRQLVTSVMGSMTPLTDAALARVARRHPLVTLKAVAMIGWQAVRLYAKGLRVFAKPVPQSVAHSATQPPPHDERDG